MEPGATVSTSDPSCRARCCNSGGVCSYGARSNDGWSAADMAPCTRRSNAARRVVHDPKRSVETCHGRSEEHTSELQSQSNLVCRLLLEKKNKTTHKPVKRAQLLAYGLTVTGITVHSDGSRGEQPLHIVRAVEWHLIAIHRECPLQPAVL